MRISVSENETQNTDIYSCDAYNVTYNHRGYHFVIQFLHKIAFLQFKRLLVCNQ